MEMTEELLAEQKTLGEMISKALINLKKDGSSRKTPKYVMDKKQLFQQYWTEFKSRHEEILTHNIADDHSYFKNGFYNQVQRYYEEGMKILTTCQKTVNEETHLDKPVNSADENKSNTPQAHTIHKSRNVEKTENDTKTETDNANRTRTSSGAAGKSEDNFILATAQNNIEQISRLKKQKLKMNSIRKIIEDIHRNRDCNHPKMYYEYKRWNLNEQFNHITELHEEINEFENEFNDSYFQLGEYENLQIIYQETMILLHEHQEADELKKDEAQPIEDAWLRLPRQTIPSFEGNYNNWPAFRDIFTKTIHCNKRLCNAEKLQYLKTHLKGEAAKLIKHLEISDSNYEAAWELISERYNNKRALLFSQLEVLVNQQHQSIETPGGLKHLHDTTRECMHAINNLGINTDTWGPIIVFYLLKRLDRETRRWYEQCSKEPREIPNLNEFLKFIETRFQSLENLKDQKKSYEYSKPNFTSRATTKTFHAMEIQCKYCNENHSIYKCKKFVAMDVNEKCRFIKDNKLCQNCLNHKDDTKCSSKNRCSICKKYHHTLLHMAQTTAGQNKEQRQMIASHSASTEVREASTNEDKRVTASYNIKLGKHVMLATALVKAQTAMGTCELLRVLIDPGSQASFVTEKAVQTLGLPRKKIEIEISGVGNTKTSTSRSQVLLNITPRFPSEYKLVLEALVLPNLTQMLPSVPISPVDLWESHNFILADPTLDTPGPIDILLGADVYGTILLDGIRKPTNELLLQNTTFGWIITGKIETKEAKTQKNVISMVSTIQLSEQLEKFWEVEEMPTRSALSEEDKIVQKHYKETHVRNNDGTYTVSMPLKENVRELGESRKLAMARFLQLEKRFQKNTTLKEEYNKFMSEYLKLGHMKEALPTVNETTYYIPHQAVIKEDRRTTKLRVVFDASAKTNTKLSLNNTMYVGPRLQQNLFDILLRWRTHKYVFKADIEKMYRMIRMNEKQQNLQRILWRFSEEEPIREYTLTTVTYGTAAAPYLAVRTLQQLAVDEHNRFPEAVNPTLKDFYVDDLMSGADSIHDSKIIMLQLIGMLKAGGFNLRKWSSNNNALHNIIPEELREQDPIEISNDESIKTLGIHWNPTTDTFQFKVNLSDGKQNPTKRNILSDIAKLFDPLGWLSPLTITAKIMMQELWMEGSSWDEKISTNLSHRWERFKRELPQIETISIPRWMHYTLTNQELELHGFCDASEKAYAAAVYSKTITKDGKIQTTLLAAKTKVAPIKLKKTLPRLELCGAALLAKLLHQIKTTMDFQHVNTYAWTDSTITLAWIKGGPDKWKTLVANKVTEILELTKSNIWHHIRSEDNPADVASRGVNPSRIHDLTLWWHGPTWLTERKENWPLVQEYEVSTTEELKRKVTCGNAIEKNKNQEELFLKYSKLPKLLRVWAYCQRFIKACRRKQTTKKHISVPEILNALTDIIRIVQQTEFAADIQKIRNNQTLEKKSVLRSLNPFLDLEEIIRVGGRIKNSNLPYNEIYPIILPSDHHVTRLIIQEAHELTLHGSKQATIAFIRRKFWIIKGTNTVKSVLRKCVRCTRFKAQNPLQQMGALPTPRVTQSKPFSHTGIDYAGPIKLRASKGRGITSHKGYIAVFVCLATKAIHLEIVSGLTTADFLAAFRRFTSRRGVCTDIYSDNATTFISANKLINQKSKEVPEKISDASSSLAAKGTNWHFIPPAGPHFGGIWEAGVKAVKYHLKRTIGETTLTYEEMSTLLCQIEACLNSRPLCPMTEDPTDLNILTPGHFLVGEALLVPPDPRSYEKTQHSLSRWQHIQKMHKDFWQAWKTDYLKQLQQRSKWKSKVANIKIGQVVLVKDEGSSPTNWPLARIIEVHPGADGLVRAVTLRYKGDHIIKRPIVKICPLPVEEHHVSEQNINNMKDARTTVTHITTTELRKQPSMEKGKMTEPKEDNRHNTATNHPTNEEKLQELVQRFKAVKDRKPRKRIHPTNIPARPSLNELLERQAKTKRTQDSIVANTEDNRRKLAENNTITLSKLMLGIMLFLFNIMSCLASNYSIKYPQPGIYVEQFGSVQIKRGTFRIEVKLSTKEITSDNDNMNKTMKQIQGLCGETRKISDETHCPGLVHHLEEIQSEIQKYIDVFKSETNKRTKRGVLGKLLETVFGVNDEVYKNIDELDHNQKLLLQTVNHQTNIMLTTIATANETETRVRRKLNSFTEKLNNGLKSIKEMQEQWFAGPDTNKINIHFLAAYHAASNYLDELTEKYHKFINVYFQNGNLLDFLKPTEISKILVKAKANIPTNLDILSFHNSAIELEFSSDGVNVFGYLNIAESSMYNLIKCTAIPQRKTDNQYVALDLASPLLAINYNTQFYFTLTEHELENCIKVKKHSVLCMPTVIRSIENYPNCVIDELYHRHEGSKCPIQHFTLTDVLWKRLHMINTWMFVANNPSTAALQCDGTREDIILNGTGIIKIPQECTIKTKRTTLKSEYSVKMPVTLSFIKPIDINTSLQTTRTFAVSAELEPVIKNSDQIYGALKADGEYIDPKGNWKTIHHHAVGAGISITTTLIITGIILVLKYKRKQKTRTQTAETTPPDSLDTISEFNLPPIVSPRQNVQN